jgi:hypothetical protein
MVVPMIPLPEQRESLGMMRTAGITDGMIGRLDVPLAAQIAHGRLRQWLVLSILLAPHQFVVTAETTMVDGGRQNGGGLFAFGIVLESERVLVGGNTPTIVLFLGMIGWLRHGRYSSSSCAERRDPRSQRLVGWQRASKE